MKPIEEKEALLCSLQFEREQLLAKVTELTTCRQALPRSAKKEATELQREIESLQAKVKGLRMPIAMALADVERTERHGLWERAVTTLWGTDGLAAARAQMRSMKMAQEAK
jgi:DNA repair exonuclease SbcCD ATPase subunit